MSAINYNLYIEPYKEEIDGIIDANDIKVLDKIPKVLKKIILKEYFQEDIFPVKLSLEKRKEIEIKAKYFKNVEKLSQTIIPNFINTVFYDLSIIDKKILMDIVWSLYVAPNEDYLFSNKKLSS